MNNTGNTNRDRLFKTSLAQALDQADPSVLWTEFSLFASLSVIFVAQDNSWITSLALCALCWMTVSSGAFPDSSTRDKAFCTVVSFPLPRSPSRYWSSTENVSSGIWEEPTLILLILCIHIIETLGYRVTNHYDTSDANAAHLLSVFSSDRFKNEDNMNYMKMFVNISTSYSFIIFTYSLLLKNDK